MVTAFVLINIQNRNVRDIASELAELPDVEETHVVAGEYDIVLLIRAEDNATLSELITDKVLHVSGIYRTKTLISLQVCPPEKSTSSN